MCLGVPGRIVTVDNSEDCLATVDVCGVKRQINVSCIIDDDHPVELMHWRMGADSCRFRDEPHRR